MKVGNGVNEFCRGCKNVGTQPKQGVLMYDLSYEYISWAWKASPLRGLSRLTLIACIRVRMNMGTVQIAYKVKKLFMEKARNVVKWGKVYGVKRLF